MSTTLTFPCACCNGLVRFEVESRQRSGTATIGGYDEFGSASTPPRKYRRKSFGGSMAGKAYFSAPCGVLALDANVSFSGANIWVPSGTGLVEVLGASAAGDLGTVSPVAGFTSAATAWLTYGSIGQTILSKTELRGQFCTNTGDCTSGCTGLFDVGSARGSQSLSEEDTEETAIARSNAVWTDWVSGIGGSCAGKELRTVGLSFGYAQAEYRIRAIGPPNGLITLERFFSRRAYGSSDPFVALFSDTTQLSSGSSGTGSWQVYAVPNDRGFQTCLTNLLRYST